MTLIHVPRPPQSALNPDRPINALLKAQIELFHKYEKRLPIQHHTRIYVSTIKTEGEAAEYIRAVTEAIHTVHAEAEAPRAKPPAPKRRRVIEFAAVADEEAERKSASKAKKEKSTAKAASSRKT